MLSQRITLLMTEIINKPSSSEELNKEYQKNLNLFKESHLILTGSKESKLHYKNTEEIKDHYFGSGNLDKTVKGFISESLMITKERDQKRIDAFSLKAKNSVLKDLDKAVKIYEEQNSSLNKILQLLEITLLIISLFILISIYIFVFIPMRATILKNEEIIQEEKDKAIKENEYKSLFLANMSHELRTPLNGVLGATDLLYSSNITGEIKDYIDMIEQSGTTLNGIINNILDLTKMEMGHMELEEKAFSPKELIEVTHTAFKFNLELYDVRFDIEMDNLPPALIGDIHRLKQILTNLVGNAQKFTKTGFIKLSATYTNGELCLIIQDSGVGMKEDALESIFDPFKQVDTSTTRSYGGTGLGLAITKEIVDHMKGTIVVESEPGKGTTFRVALPLVETAPEGISHDEGIQKNISFEGKLTFLVVDDNEINRKLLTRILERMEINTHVASSGEEAIKEMQENSFDLVFMDYHMPKMDGPEAVSRARELLGEKLPKIICLTADLSEESIKIAKNSGMLDVLAKPIRKARLQEVIESLFD